jgi:sulfatase modifying factor 1
VLRALAALIDEELSTDERALLVHASFPRLAPADRTLDLVEAIEQSGQLGRLFSILHRERPFRSDDLAAIEDTLAPQPPQPAPGETLDAAVRAGKVSRNDAINLTLKLAAELAPLHRRGAAHGSVHPGNIRLVDGVPSLTHDLPSPPFFIPPEAAAAVADEPRADIHSLARTLIFCLHQADPPPEATHNITRFIRRLSIVPGIRRVLLQAASVPLAETYADIEVFREHLLAARRADADLLLVSETRPIRMVRIPGGRSALGGTPLGVSGQVASIWEPCERDVAGFFLSETPVTQAQWDAVLGERHPNPARHEEPDAPVEQVQWIAAIRFLNALSKREGRRPAYRIHRGDLVEWYTDRDGYRLPTEVEWEHACRAGTRSRFHTGDGDDAMDAAGWYAGNTGGAGTMPVRWKACSPLGLYDMHGNVGEWCWDAWSDRPTPEPPALKQTKTSGLRVYRGGGWVLSAVLCSAGCRCRVKIDGKTSHDYIGFRIAQSILSSG